MSQQRGRLLPEELAFAVLIVWPGWTLPRQLEAGRVCQLVENHPEQLNRC